MKKLNTLLAAGGMFAGTTLFAQSAIDMNLLTEESDVAVTMDLQPVLQITMTTPDQILFTFNTINSYMAGITHYGATVLKVSSTVDWDLVAVGTSSDNEASAGASKVWDNPVQYTSGNSVNQVNGVPLSSLELWQLPPNPMGSPSPLAANLDYSSAYIMNPGSANAFTGATPSPNAVEVGDQSGGTFINFANTTDQRIVAGDLEFNGALGVGSAMAPGSALSTLNQAYQPGDFKYNISYRIVPGLPATFPLRDVDDYGASAPATSPTAAGQYVAPGVYTMEVRYILTEDQ